MKRTLLLLALCVPLTLVGCARTGETARTGEAGGGTPSDGMMTEEMAEDAAERTGIPGDMIAGASASATLVENAMAVAELSTLVEALKAAGLVEVLSGPGPYTIFAPTNQAFDLVDADEMVSADLSAEDKEKLAMLLKSHVVDGKIMFGELNDGEIVKTLSGADYGVSLEDGGLEKRIGEADIIAYDIESSNGVIHVVNLVLDDDGFFSQ